MTKPTRTRLESIVAPMLLVLWAAGCGNQADDSSEDVTLTGGTASNATATGGTADSFGGTSTAAGGTIATGGFINDSECPATQPESNNPCASLASPLTLSCGYDGASCTCTDTLEGEGAWILRGVPLVSAANG